MKNTAQNDIVSFNDVEKDSILVIGGSPECYGSAILASLAAEATGIRMINLYTCPLHIEAAKRYSLNFRLYSFPKNPGYLSLHDVKTIQSIGASVMLIGNGMGGDFDAKKATLAIINTDKPIIIDDSAIMSELLKVYDAQRHKWILMMNAMDFKNIFKCEVTQSNIEKMSIQHRINLCVKSVVSYTSISNNFDMLEYKQSECGKLYIDGHSIDYNSISGINNVLSGIICGYIAQGHCAQSSILKAIECLGLAIKELSKNHKNFTARNLIKFYMKYMVNHNVSWN